MLRLWQTRLTTMLLVTHDIDEAIYMSDRILIMTPRPGRIDRTISVEILAPEIAAARIPSASQRDPSTAALGRKCKRVGIADKSLRELGREKAE